MTFRILILSAAFILATFPAFAQENNLTHDNGFPGAKSDPTSRDSSYINDATTAGDRITEEAQREKSSAVHIRPQHRVILRQMPDGSVQTTVVYLIPPPANGE